MSLIKTVHKSNKMCDDDYTIFKKTIYGEARGEPRQGQEAVAWVIKNRAEKNRSYWGGSKIGDVCRHPNQFECWKSGDIQILEKKVYDDLDKWLPDVYRSKDKSRDPTGGCDHFINPDKVRAPSWTKNFQKGPKIGGHQFYRGN